MKTWNTSDDTPPPAAGTVTFARQPSTPPYGNAPSPAVFGKSISQGMANNGQYLFFGGDHSDFDTRYYFPAPIHLKNLGVVLYTTAGSGHKSVGIYAHKTNGQTIELWAAINSQIPVNSAFYVDLNVDITGVDYISVRMDMDYNFYIFSVSAIEQIQGNIEKARSTYQYCTQKEIERFAVGCIFQNRHILAKTSILASALGAYDNFDNRIQNQIADDAPFLVMQNTFKFGQVLCLVMFKQGILALTTDQEIFIYGEGIITPSTASQIIIGERGSENVQPVIIEQGFIGVERGGNLYFQSYNLANGSYERVSLSQYAQHLFKGHKITQIESLSANDNTIFILFDDGVLLRLYMDLNSGVLAYSRISGLGAVKTAAVVDSENEKNLFLTTDDAILKLNNVVENDVFVDKAKILTAEGDNKITAFEISGDFNAQDDLYLQAFDGGKVWYEKISEAPGQTHTLKAPAQKVYYGINIVSEIETTDIGAGDDAFYADKSRAAQCVAGLVDSYGVKFGKVKMPELVDNFGNPIIYTGKYKTPVFGVSAMEKTLKIYHDKPCNFTIASLDISIR